MNLLDSNIVIYTGQSQFQWLRQLLQHLPCALSVATKIEVLGYHKLTPEDQADLEYFFSGHGNPGSEHRDRRPGCSTTPAEKNESW